MTNDGKERAPDFSCGPIVGVAGPGRFYMLDGNGVAWRWSPDSGWEEIGTCGEQGRPE